MKKVVCDKCGYHFEVEDGAEFGYCPCCENDQVEINYTLWKFANAMDNVSKHRQALEEIFKENMYNKMGMYDFESRIY